MEWGGNPLARHPFGESFLTQNFPVGSVVPSLDYRMPAPVESQYDTYQFISPYDSIADWPDRPDNWMSVANAIVGLFTGHTAVAFTEPLNVPQQNIRTTVNSRGAKTTTYMVPEEHLPLVLPFKYLGVPKETLTTPTTAADFGFAADPVAQILSGLDMVSQQLLP